MVSVFSRQLSGIPVWSNHTSNSSSSEADYFQELSAVGVNFPERFVKKTRRENLNGVEKWAMDFGVKNGALQYRVGNRKAREKKKRERERESCLAIRKNVQYEVARARWDVWKIDWCQSPARPAICVENRRRDDTIDAGISRAPRLVAWNEGRLAKKRAQVSRGLCPLGVVVTGRTWSAFLRTMLRCVHFAFQKP